MQDEEVKQEEEKLKEELAQREPEGEIVTLGPNLACGSSEHIFELSRNELGIIAKCTKCPVCYPLGVGDSVKDGHIYKFNQFVI